MKFLQWLSTVLERWTQHEYEKYFRGVDVNNIKDIDKFLRERGLML